MDTTHDHNHNTLTIILTIIAFIGEIARRMLENYDTTFKIATLSVLALSIIVNLDKAVRVVGRYVVNAYKWITKK